MQSFARVLIMRDVTLKQLRYLTATIRTGSLVGAAAELHLTAPAVAAQLRFLEKSIGLTLLERGPGGQRATEAGRLLMYTGARIEAELAACDDAVSALRSAHVGRVSLGAVSTAKYFAPHVLASFQREHPDISVTLSIGNRDEVLARLEGYDVDLAVMGRAPVRIEAEQEEFGEHPYVIIAAPDHSLVQQHEIPFAKIATETFLMRESGSGTRLHLEALFASAGVLPIIGMEIASNETIKQAVMAGLGLALISAHTIAAEVQDGRLAILDVVGLPIRRKWLVVRMSRRALSPATQALWDFFRTEGSRQLPTVGH
jgi:DNA-binding transcriptional LysR family regulator